MGFITFQYHELPCTLVNYPPIFSFDGQAVDIITRTTQRSKAYPQCSSSSKMEYVNLGSINSVSSYRKSPMLFNSFSINDTGGEWNGQ